MNWKKGDIAICVNADSFNSNLVAPPLRLNAEYIVNSVSTCKCGRVSLDVGLISKGTTGRSRCLCGETTKTGDIHICYAGRFIKKDPRSLEERIAEAVEKEEYELAHELKQQLA
jgi:hypothetical protein